MKKPYYKNYKHYLDEGWNKKPKKIFVELGNIIKNLKKNKPFKLLDIGCAHGEFLGYVKKIFPKSKLTGIDVNLKLLKIAKTKLPSETFYKKSALSLKPLKAQSFEIITAIGLINIFDYKELENFIKNALRLLPKNGILILMSPFNEFGMDLEARHRKRINNILLDWERGNSIYAKETIFDIAKNNNCRVKFVPFNLKMRLPKKNDPQRTWTIKLKNNKYQLINGLKILMNIYSAIIFKQ